MSFWAPNIDNSGRIARGILGLGLIVGAFAFFTLDLPLPGWLLVGGGVFCLFEAARGWCIARACRIKTPL
jgi:hypothetical protein